MEYMAALHGIMAVKKYKSDICTVCKLILALLWLSTTLTLDCCTALFLCQTKPLALPMFVLVYVFLYLSLYNLVFLFTVHCIVLMSDQTCATIYGLCV